MLNLNKNRPIEFSSEIEANNKLDLLDLEFTRNEITYKLEFNIFRKQRSSFKPIYQQKRSAIRSIIDRLINIPLSEINYANKLLKFKEIVKVKDFYGGMVDKLVIAHKRKIEYPGTPFTHTL